MKYVDAGLSWPATPRVRSTRTGIKSPHDPRPCFRESSFSHPKDDMELMPVLGCSPKSKRGRAALYSTCMASVLAA